VADWTYVVAEGVQPAPSALAALEAAREAMPSAALLAARVPGDPVWPRILDKEDAIEGARRGLVALRAVQPGVLLVRGDTVPASFLDVARALTSARGYLVPGAEAARTGPPPALPRARVLAAPFWTREERLWQLFIAVRRP
jgi:hypothetical protein